MAASTHLVLPDLGVSAWPIVVSSWLVKEGTEVADGEPVLELLCGCVTVDLPSPAAGVLAQKAVAEGDSLTVGQRLGRIEPPDDH